MRVAAWQLFGSLFFGAVNKLEELLDPRVGRPEVVILDMTRLIHLDTTGLKAWRACATSCRNAAAPDCLRHELAARFAAVSAPVSSTTSRRRQCLQRPQHRRARLYPAAQPQLRRRILLIPAFIETDSAADCGICHRHLRAAALCCSLKEGSSWHCRQASPISKSVCRPTQ